ncbi:hypothetical protein BY458DRAFT_472874 [Sporodiniella umbellata]|nr:hypothetical protein BY458DRAFT_472874 [Sporodiniella umbellata]
MTVNNSFPLGYFYIVSRLNDLVLDIRESEHAAIGSKIVMNTRKPLSPERDSQLWIHQDGFLTNKQSGLVLDINRADGVVAFFTRESKLYLDKMKDQESANDQRFGFEIDTGYIFVLSDPHIVIDIRHEDINEDARVMVYHKKPIEEAVNQLWLVEPADPPSPVDSDDESEDEGKRARLKAWFGNWKGWGHKRHQVLAQSDLEEANKKVYKEKKANASLELIAAAVAYEAVNMWEKKHREEGAEIHHSTAKKIIAGIAAAELVKLLQERGSEEIKDNHHKKDMMTNMTVNAATNLFESKHVF